MVIDLAFGPVTVSVVEDEQCMSKAPGRATS